MTARNIKERAVDYNYQYTYKSTPEKSTSETRNLVSAGLPSAPRLTHCFHSLRIASMESQSRRTQPRSLVPFLSLVWRTQQPRSLVPFPSLVSGVLSLSQSSCLICRRHLFSAGSELFCTRPPPPHYCAVCRQPIKVLEVETGRQLVDHFLQGQKRRDDLESKEDSEDDMYCSFQGQVPQAFIKEQEKD